MAADTEFVQKCFDEGRTVPRGRWHVDGSLQFPEGTVTLAKGCVLVTAGPITVTGTSIARD